MKSPLSDEYIARAAQRDYERYRDLCNKRRWPHANEAALLEMGRSQWAGPLFIRRRRSGNPARATRILAAALMSIGLMVLAQVYTHGRFL